GGEGAELGSAQGWVDAAGGTAARTGGLGARVGLDVAGAGVVGGDEPHDRPGQRLGLDPLGGGIGQQRLLRRVGAEGGLRQNGGYAGGALQDAVVVAALRVGAVLRAGVPVGCPLDVIVVEGGVQLLVDQAGGPLRVGRGDLVVGLGAGRGSHLVGV